MLIPKPLAILAATLLPVLTATCPAVADPADSGSVSIDQNANNDSADLTVTAGTSDTRPGGSAGGGGPSGTTKSAGTSTCTYEGEPIPCTSAAGVWNGERGCYVQRMSPQPPFDYPGWNGRTDGSLYMCYSPSGGGMGDYEFWAPAAGAAGAPVLVDPVTVAEEAVDSMDLRAVEIGITPPPGPDSYTLLGLPTWLWVADPTPNTWGPISRTASSDGVSVTATARVDKVVWDMGDGTQLSCGKGTPYHVAFDDDPSPTCGHTYRGPGTFPVTATSYWEVDWSGAGQSGTITFTLSRDTSVTVREAFALVTEQG